MNVWLPSLKADHRGKVHFLPKTELNHSVCYLLASLRRRAMLGYEGQVYYTSKGIASGCMQGTKERIASIHGIFHLKNRG
mmetsp:Transcript_6619/g.23347  ORF Transcript_6619/g.23347 Transcript_6619/m.23347 type:complete len:80 (+) Transcript_6619:1085-1324(+)